MVDTLFFVHSNQEAADQFAEEYRSRGWDVASADATATDALDRVAEASPVAAVFCLEGDCAAEVNHLAESVMTDGRIHRPLLVFVGGEPEDIAAAHAAVPFGVFVRKDELPWVLRRLIAKS